MTITERTANVFAADLAAIVAHSHLWPDHANEVFMSSTLKRHQKYADDWQRAQDQMAALTVDGRASVVRVLDEMTAFGNVRELSSTSYYGDTMDWLRARVPAVTLLFAADRTALADLFRDVSTVERAA